MDETALIHDIDSFIAQHRDAVLSDMKALVDIDSVETQSTPDAPFGLGARKALDKALEIADRMGLSTHDCEGYLGYADVPGQSETQIATITHVDVVPAGNGWTTDPFCMEVKDGYALGRGVLDDKGPAILTLYAAKFFHDAGKPLPYTLRILLGANEETGMKDIDYYLAHNPQPAFCFTPDGEFPVCYGEKGGFNGTLCSAKLHGTLVDFSGGVAVNAVSDRATALVRADAKSLPDTEHVKITQENDCACITGYGISGHASMPEGTVNAIGLVVDYLLEHSLCSAEEEAFLKLLQSMHASTDGSSIGIAAKDEFFTPLTCVGGVISMTDGVLRQSIDIRFPSSITHQTITARFEALAQAAGATLEAGKHQKEPFCIDPNTPVIQTLIRTYNEVTGNNKEPFTMGGGTYACHFDNAVSFGLEELDAPTPDWVGAMHGANEGVSIDLLFTSLKIYILAIARLMELDF